MHMWYWFGKDLGAFLFEGYNVKSTWGLVATCLGLGALAVVYEAMKVLQVKLRQMTVASLPEDFGVSSENSSLLSRIYPNPLGPSTATPCKSWAHWLMEVFHWFVHTTLGYVLMLAVMSYNGYISIALAIGGGLGYWIFGLTLVQLNQSQFHNKRRIIQCDPECSDAIPSTERRPSRVTVDAEHIITDAMVEVHA